MNVVLVCINVFQDYILHNITQLIKLNHTHIYILTNERFFPLFDIFSEKIKLINIDTLSDTFNFYSKTTLDKSFRNGFWTLTSLRFFYIYEFMKQYEINNVIHLENDVPIYYNCDELLNCLNINFMYIPFDTYKRNIASIVYIPNKEIYKKILDNYNFNINDMENFSIIKQKTGLIKNFPIFINHETLTEEQKFVCNTIDNFPFIFDAAAIGQYLGGVDPRNKEGNTQGFVNETCIIKYNNYHIWFEEINGIKKPFIQIEDKKVPIFNLHIHSKKLEKYI
jgi:hypothetical protein